METESGTDVDGRRGQRRTDKAQHGQGREEQHNTAVLANSARRSGYIRWQPNPLVTRSDRI